MELYVRSLRASIRGREQQDILVWVANKGKEYKEKQGYKAALPTQEEE